MEDNKELLEDLLTLLEDIGKQGCGNSGFSVAEIYDEEYEQIKQRINKALYVES